MDLRPKFKAADIRKFVKSFNKNVHEAIIDRFNYIGETAVADAKLNKTYKDRTGNLTASISYITLFNGKKVSPGRIPKQSRDLIAELTAILGKGYVLIIVAGMDYAAAVESKGYDVITGSSNRAIGLLKDAIKKIAKNVRG